MAFFETNRAKLPKLLFCVNLQKVDIVTRVFLVNTLCIFFQQGALCVCFDFMLIA